MVAKDLEEKRINVIRMASLPVSGRPIAASYRNMIIIIIIHIPITGIYQDYLDTLVITSIGQVLSFPPLKPTSGIRPDPTRHRRSPYLPIIASEGETRRNSPRVES